MDGVKLTGLWKNVNKNGKTFLSGSMGGVKVLVFPNDYKKTEMDPDYNLFFAPKEEKKADVPKAPAGDL